MKKNNEFLNRIKVEPKKEQQDEDVDPRMSELLRLRREEQRKFQQDEEKRKYMEQMNAEKNRKLEEKYAEERFVKEEAERILREERLSIEKQKREKSKARKRAIAGFLVAASLFTAGIGTYKTMKYLEDRKNRIDAQAEIEDDTIKPDRIVQKTVDENGNIVVTYDNPRPAYYRILSSSNIDEIVSNNPIEETEKQLKGRELEIAWLTLRMIKASFIDSPNVKEQLPPDEIENQVNNVRITNSPRMDVNNLTISIPGIEDISNYDYRNNHNNKIPDNLAKTIQKAVENIYALENDQRDKPTITELIEYYNEVHRLLETGNFTVNNKGEVEFVKGINRTMDEKEGRS